MPDFKFEAIAILVVLLPGFFAARIEQRLTVNPEQKDFDKIVEALIYSFFIYLTFTAITHSFPISLRVDKEGPSANYSISASPLRLALLPMIAVVLATIVSSATNHDWFGGLFRWLQVTSRTWRSSIWNDVFQLHGGVVQVELSDGRSVIGWLKYYSDRPDNASLFLERASWVRDDGQPVEIIGPGILLTGENHVRSIMFLDAGNPDPDKS